MKNIHVLKTDNPSRLVLNSITNDLFLTTTIFVETMENIPGQNDKLKKAFEDFNKQKKLEKYSERFDNKDNEVVDGIFNPENWGRRIVKQNI